MNPIEQFKLEVNRNISGLGQDKELHALSNKWLHDISKHKYPYNFEWLGRPIIQIPQDMVALQELIFSVKPDLIIETGIAHGGSLVYSASILALLDYCDAVETDEVLDPKNPKRKVLGIDIDIRAHNRAAIEAHPMAKRIEMIEGSSIATDVITRVHAVAARHGTVMVILDSNHTHEHVLAELEAYAPLTSQGSYCIVFDTLIEDMPDEMFEDRPWGKGNNPKTAVWEYLRRLKLQGRKANDGKDFQLEIDKMIDSKLLLTVAPNGYLKRVTKS